MTTEPLDVDLEWRFEKPPQIPIEQQRRAQRMVASMGRYLTLLTERPVATELRELGWSPAWSSSNRVYYALAHLGDLSMPDAIASAKGLTLHEAAHILFSPRAGAPLVTWVHQVQTGTWPGFTDHVSEQFPGRETGASLLPIARAYNLLEDQRIETILVGRFGHPVIPWLTSTATQYLLSSPDDLPLAHPFTWGRTYLPFAVRDGLRRRFASVGNADRLAHLIDEYRAIHPEQQIARARTLIFEFAALLERSYLGLEHGCEGHRVDRHEASATSSPESAEAQRELFDRGRAIERAALGETLQARGDDEGADADAGLDRELRGAQRDAVATVARELRRDAGIYRGSRERLTASRPTALPPDKAVEVRVTADAKLGSSAFSRELEALRVEHEAAWERRTSGGRLNAGRYLRGAELDEAFDRWTLGRDDTLDLEVVVALDCSGSMHGESIEQAAQAMWALKRAVDRVQGACTVLAFTNESFSLYRADEKAGEVVREPHAEGGTDPYDALVHAERVFTTTERAVQLLVVISDGMWQGAERSDEVIATLREQGVLTAIIALGSEAIGSHGCELRQNTGSASALFTLGRDLVRTAIQRNLLEGVAA